MSRTNSRTGAQVLVDQLRLNGVDTVFCVPGESYLAVLDALYDHRDAIRLITCRHESGAANMAEAYGKLTGKPGICFVTRGPGATQGSVGVHTGQQDSTPMIYFIGQVGRDMMEREAFQEIDYRRMFGQMSKWVAEIDDADRMPEFLHRAFTTALTGRPGPVVLALPEDMLTDVTAAQDLAPARPARAVPGGDAMAELRGLLAKAERPLVIAGGPGWSRQAADDLATFATANRMPIASAFRRQDCFDNDHPCYAGVVGIAIAPPLKERVEAADLLLVIGPRLGEMTTGGYTLITPPRPKQTLVHVMPGAEELGRVYQADLPILSDLTAFCAALATLDPIESPVWAGESEVAHAAYLDFIRPTTAPGAVNMAEIVHHLDSVLPDDAIVTNGAGNYTVWGHRFYRFHRPGTQVGPTSGAMGYGVPAAVAAKAVHRDRMVVALSGDGCFLMSGQELATAVQYDLPIVVVIMNNGMYGTIRMHQEREYPNRISGTDLANPDFVKLAEAYGCHGERVTETAAFPAAFERALASGKPAVIDVVVDPEALTPRASLSDIRDAALAKRA